MGVQERKDREKAERKAMIIRHTKDLIVEKGVDSFSMLDIAKRAELSKATLYLYFPSKEAILEAIFNEAGSFFFNYVNARLDRASSGIEAIRAIWMSYLEIFGGSRDLFVMFGIKNYIAPGFPLVYDEKDMNPERSHFRLYQLISRVLERGLADGTLDPSIAPEKIARTVIMIADGIVDNVARLPLELRDTAIIIQEMKSTFEIVLRGLAAPGIDRSLLVLADRI